MSYECRADPAPEPCDEDLEEEMESQLYITCVAEQSEQSFAEEGRWTFDTPNDTSKSFRHKDYTTPNLSDNRLPPRDSGKSVVTFSLNDSADSTDLVSQFEKIRINGTPFRPSEANTTVIAANPKPDVLLSAENEQKDKEFEEKIKIMESDLKEKNSQIEELSTELKKLFEMVDVMHKINEELIIKAHEIVDRKEAEMDQKVKSLMNSIASLESENKGLKNELFCAEEELRREKSKPVAQQTSGNEIMTFKVQLKRLEMKNKALENELESKKKENIELSAMADHLIAKVHGH